MNTIRLSLPFVFASALALPALAPPSTAQDPGPPAAQEPPAVAVEIDALVEALGNPVYTSRRDAEQTLRRRGAEPPVRAALERAAEEHADAEVRWRAGRLLRELAQPDPDGGGLRPSERGKRAAPPALQRRGPTHDLDDMFDSLFRRLEQDFDMDIPRRQFFNDGFFRDLRQQMLDQMQMGDLQGGLGSATQIQVGPDGVEVKLQETNEAGEAETKTYSAPDMESFREQYPEVAEKVFDGNGGLRLRLGRRLEPAVPWARGPGARVPGVPAPLPAVDDGPKLGVYIEPIGDELRGFLGLPEGQGLRVREVVAGSLAARLGLAAGDVLLEIEGQPVGSPQDVSRALRAADGQVSVRANRRGSDRELSAEYQPSDAEAKTEPGKLRPRR